MKKIIVGILALFPVVVFASVDSLNGQTGTTQTFVNDSNVEINSSGDTHTINWNGILPVSRGGLGTTTSATGSIPVFWNGMYEGDSWMNLNKDTGNFVIGQPEITTTIRPGDGGSMRILTGGGIGAMWLGMEDFSTGIGMSNGNGLDMYSVDGLIKMSSPNSTFNMDVNNITYSNQAYGVIPAGLSERTDEFCFKNLGNCTNMATDPMGTTTINFGVIGSSTARTCFNTKNTNGDDISFYFAGTSMVVENNVCQ